jgi:hypothetical protein
VTGCLAPAQDPDVDNLESLTETTPRELKVALANGTELRMVTSDPDERDTDRDGLDDEAEADGHTDPRDVDTDRDGLLDGPDLTRAEAEGAGLLAELEARGIVTDPVDGRFLGEIRAHTKPFDWDGDRPFPDGLGDGDELRGWNVTLRGGTRLVRGDPTLPDSEGDSLNDLEEQRRGCDPGSADTDGDGVPDPVDADCVHDVRLSMAVGRLDLARGLDPAGDTDLVIEAQAVGKDQSFAQAVRAGNNTVTFRWLVDVPDQGLWQSLRVPLALAFWDRDPPGDDAQSGVQRQPLCVVQAQDPCNVLNLDVDVFARRWTSAQGASGEASGTASGPDGAVTFTLQPLLE